MLESSYIFIVLL